MYEYKVKELVKVVDGDTVDAVIDLGFSLALKQRLRLTGIDAPELLSKDPAERQLAQEAKDFLTGKLYSAKAIRIATSKDDKYGHILAEIHLDDDESSLNDQMVKRGFAWSYDGGSKVKDFAKLAEARASWSNS